MENANYNIKEAIQAIQELDFGEDTCNINQYTKKRMQNNDISKIINMEKLFHVEKTVGQGQKF